MKKIFLKLFLFFTFQICAEQIDNQNIFYDGKTACIFNDLSLVKEINNRLNDSLPVTYNNLLQGGYFSMPSARMKKAGNVALGFSYLPPYRVLSGNFQYFDHLELSANYWIFHGIMEKGFGHLGYGDDADRSANIKVAFLQQKDGYDFLPEFAFGLNDFMGSKRFHSKYIVGTQQLLDLNVEASMGWGIGRIKGFFGGVSYIPLRKCDNFLKNLVFSLEYDGNDYKHHEHEHPNGKKVSSPINVGIHYADDCFQAVVSTIRGRDISASLFLNYNFGETSGFFTKIKDPPIYRTPVNFELLGPNRTQNEIAQELAYAFQKQGFEFYELKLICSDINNKKFWIRIVNNQYRFENQVRENIQGILSSLTPEDISSVTVVVESEGISVQEYFFQTKYLQKYREKQIGEYELETICPIKNVNSVVTHNQSLLFYQNKKSWLINLRPKINNYFGSGSGKLKGDYGILAGLEGYLFNQIYYNMQGSYIFLSSNANILDWDRYNPSKIINVRTDTIRYWQENSLHLEQAYMQKAWNLNKGAFARIACGYFETAYAGVALELLYYPVKSNWAIGFEMATLLKRKYDGLGFQHKIRKWKNNKAIYEKFVGFQTFLDFYYDINKINIFLKTSVGQFLAKDKGIKFDMTRYFKNGFEVSVWYTLTNAKDVVNGKRYFDKGFSFSFPLDFFMNKSSRTKMSYGMSEWLRDVGAKAKTGKELFPIIHDERHE